MVKGVVKTGRENGFQRRRDANFVLNSGVSWWKNKVSGDMDIQIMFNLYQQIQIELMHLLQVYEASCRPSLLLTADVQLTPPTTRR